MFTWATSGTKTITVTAFNFGQPVTTTLFLSVTVPPAPPIVPILGITLDGPTNGITGTPYGYSATVTPTNTTLPITYTWQATDQSTLMRTGGMTDGVSYTWTTTGTKQITVTALNVGQPVTATLTVNVSATSTTPEPTPSPSPTPTGQVAYLPIAVNQAATGW
jgi:hypothetical protein